MISILLNFVHIWNESIILAYYHHTYKDESFNKYFHISSYSSFSICLLKKFHLISLCVLLSLSLVLLVEMYQIISINL